MLWQPSNLKAAAVEQSSARLSGELSCGTSAALAADPLFRAPGHRGRDREAFH